MMKSSLTGRVKDKVAEMPRAPQREMAVCTQTCIWKAV